MEPDDVRKHNNYVKYVIPLALMKREGVKQLMFHWKIVISQSYPFEAPKVYNLDGIQHPEIDQLTGQATVRSNTSVIVSCARSAMFVYDDTFACAVTIDCICIWAFTVDNCFDDHCSIVS